MDLHSRLQAREVAWVLILSLASGCTRTEELRFGGVWSGQVQLADNGREALFREGGLSLRIIQSHVTWWAGGGDTNPVPEGQLYLRLVNQGGLPVHLQANSVRLPALFSHDMDGDWVKRILSTEAFQRPSNLVEKVLMPGETLDIEFERLSVRPTVLVVSYAVDVKTVTGIIAFWVRH